MHTHAYTILRAIECMKQLRTHVACAQVYRLAGAQYQRRKFQSLIMLKCTP